MRRLVGIPLLLLVAACASTGPAQPGPSTDNAAFARRAAAVAAAWRAAPGHDSWRTGFVPQQDLTVPPALTDATKQAFVAGWFRAATALPATTPRLGTVRFPDGSVLSVPLESAAKAYAAIDQGDPPPCRDIAPSPSPDVTGPDGSVGHFVDSPCDALVVTHASLGTVRLRTSRGGATVPAWLFTIRGLAGPVARVAVAPSAIASGPQAQPPTDVYGPDLVGAQDLTGVDGATLSYRLGVGACDKDIRPLVYERDDVVVVGGRVTRGTGVCTDQLLLQPVTVTLAEPLGGRAVLDAGSGRLLTLTVR